MDETPAASEDKQPIKVVVKRDAKGRLASSADAAALANQRHSDTRHKKLAFFDTMLKQVTKKDFARIVDQVVQDCLSTNTRLATASRELLFKHILPQKQELDVTVQGRMLSPQEEAEIIRAALDAKLGLTENK